MDMVASLFDDALKITLKAPPVDNAANKSCLGFLAKTLKIPKRSISITAGLSSRTKHIFIRCDAISEQKSATIKKGLVSLANT